MTRRTPPAPRLRWIGLVLAMVLLFAELCLDGYVRRIGAEGDDRPPAAAPADAATAGGGPVLQLASGVPVRTLRMPPGAVALTFDDGRIHGGHRGFWTCCAGTVRGPRSSSWAPGSARTRN